MPTFFNPGGRTLGGGDIMSLPMPWPRAAPARSASPRKACAIEFTNCLVLLTANVLSRAGCPAPASAVNFQLPEAAALVVRALGVCFITGAEGFAAEVFSVEVFAAELGAEDAPSACTGKPRFAINSMARSIGIRRIPLSLSTQS